MNQSLIFQTIAKYSEPWRRFHTMEHLGWLWRQFERASVLNPLYRQYRQAMEVLIPFHDWVYVPGSKTNEIESAEAATYWLTTAARRTRVMKVGFGAEARTLYTHHEILMGQIPRIILGTQHHTSPLTDMEALFFDMDLSGLGSDPIQYDRTSMQVAQEFTWSSPGGWPFCPVDAFIEGRSEWLKGMLRRPRLFNLPEFEQFECPARENMASELAHMDRYKYL